MQCLQTPDSDLSMQSLNPLQNSLNRLLSNGCPDLSSAQNPVSVAANGEQTCIARKRKLQSSPKSKVTRGRRPTAAPKENEKAPKTDYIHVRARRGQATDSHSLAERVCKVQLTGRHLDWACILTRKVCRRGGKGSARGWSASMNWCPDAARPPERPACSTRSSTTFSPSNDKSRYIRSSNFSKVTCLPALTSSSSSSSSCRWSLLLWILLQTPDQAAWACHLRRWWTCSWLPQIQCLM